MARVGTLTKLEIIKEASKQFLHKGYSNTTVLSVARALDISSGNLTFHFPTKEHLLAELVDMLCAFNWEQMQKEKKNDIRRIDPKGKRY